MYDLHEISLASFDCVDSYVMPSALVQIRHEISNITKCQPSRLDVHFSNMEEIIFNIGGLDDMETRKSLWAVCLGLHPSIINRPSLEWKIGARKHMELEKEARQIRQDINRSLFSIDVHRDLTVQRRSRLRNELSLLLHGVLQAHKKSLSYTQGLHDVASIFLHVFGCNSAFAPFQRFSLIYAADMLGAPFQQSVLPILNATSELLALVDHHLWLALQFADASEMHVCIPWLLTFFSHSVERMDTLLKLWDGLFAVGHPAFIIYLMAATIRVRRSEIIQLATESGWKGGEETPLDHCLMPKIHSLFSAQDENDDFFTEAQVRVIMKDAHRLFILHPPESMPQWRNKSTNIPTFSILRQDKFPFRSGLSKTFPVIIPGEIAVSQQSILPTSDSSHVFTSINSSTLTPQRPQKGQYSSSAAPQVHLDVWEPPWIHHCRVSVSQNGGTPTKIMQSQTTKAQFIKKHSLQLLVAIGVLTALVSSLPVSLFRFPEG